MKYGYLTDGERKQNMEELERLKSILIRWFQPIPAEAFEGTDNAYWFSPNAPTWNYKPRYLKTRFLRAIREAGHISELPRILSCLSTSRNLLLIFLASHLSVRNWRTTRGLIDFVGTEDEYENQCGEMLERNYDEMLDAPRDSLLFHLDGINFVPWADCWHPVPIKNRLTTPECEALLSCELIVSKSSNDLK